MAIPDINKDVFRQRFRQKLADHYADTSETGFLNTEQNNHEQDGEKPMKNSPFSVQNFILLGLAMFVLYFSDFTNVLMYDLRIKSTWFWIGVLSLGLFVGIAVFLVFWLTFWKKISSDEWEKRYPLAVPIATASLIFGIICLCTGLWPVWGFLTPVYFLILLLGTVVVVAMIG